MMAAAQSTPVICLVDMGSVELLTSTTAAGYLTAASTIITVCEQWLGKELAI